MRLAISKKCVEIFLTDRDMELLSSYKPVSINGIEANDTRPLIITYEKGKIEGKIKEWNRDAKAIKELTGEDPVKNFKGYNPKAIKRDFNPQDDIKQKPFGLKQKEGTNVEEK